MESSIAKTFDINHVHFNTSRPFFQGPEIFLDKKPLYSIVVFLVFQDIVGERQSSVEVLLSCEWIGLVGGPVVMFFNCSTPTSTAAKQLGTNEENQ